jgi:hypothetical protein
MIALLEPGNLHFSQLRNRLTPACDGTGCHRVLAQLNPAGKEGARATLAFRTRRTVGWLRQLLVRAAAGLFHGSTPPHFPFFKRVSPQGQAAPHPQPQTEAS